MSEDQLVNKLKLLFRDKFCEGSGFTKYGYIDVSGHETEPFVEDIVKFFIHHLLNNRGEK